MIYKLKVIDNVLGKRIKVTLEADSNLVIKVAYSREKEWIENLDSGSNNKFKLFIWSNSYFNFMFYKKIVQFGFYH